jgi:Na+/H+ antiporter 1
VLVGVGIWLCTLKSGVHPTVAGALLGLLTPASAWLRRVTLFQVVQRAVEPLRKTDAGSGPDAERRAAAEDLAFAATESVSPLAIALRSDPQQPLQAATVEAHDDLVADHADGPGRAPSPGNQLPRAAPSTAAFFAVNDTP